MSDPIVAPARHEPWVLPDGRPTQRFARWAESITSTFNTFVTDSAVESGLNVGLQGEIAALKRRICDIETEL